MAEQTTENIYASQNFYEYALSSPLSHEPGTHFFYNNNAVNLLPAIIEKASGMKIDVFLEKYLFDKLGIPKSDWNWSIDKSGNPHGMAGLQMKANGLIKIGQLMLSNGIWEDNAIIDESWIQMSFESNKNFPVNSGLLWWIGRDYQKDYLYYDDKLLERYKNAAIPKNYVYELEKIKNKKMLRADWYQKIIELFGSKEQVNKFISVAKDNDLPFSNVTPSPALFYSAEGYLGQYLIIIPETKIVGVRLIHEKSAGDGTQFSNFSRKLTELK